jgi:hypothetical protein
VERGGLSRYDKAMTDWLDLGAAAIRAGKKSVLA